MEEVLRHYSKRIRMAALENGHINMDTQDSIKQRFISALFRFRFDAQATYIKTVKGVGYKFASG